MSAKKSLSLVSLIPEDLAQVISRKPWWNDCLIIVIRKTKAYLECNCFSDLLSWKYSAELCMIRRTHNSHHQSVLTRLCPPVEMFYLQYKTFLNDVSVFCITHNMEFYGIARPGETKNLQFLNRYHIQKNKMPEILTFYLQAYTRVKSHVRGRKTGRRSRYEDCLVLWVKTLVLHSWVQDDSQVTFHS